VERQWATEFRGTDGHRYSGPIILADGLEMAVAINSVLRSYDGQRMDVTGEILLSVPQGETTEVYVRRLS